MRRLQEDNLAFIDAQNLYFGTTKCFNCAKKLNIDLTQIKLIDCVCGTAWKIDLKKFRIYLKDKYHIKKAYYFIGNYNEENQSIYREIENSGFFIIFKEHHQLARSGKKGNVDADIIFEIMKHLIENKNFNKIMLVSGDGDYIKVIEYLIGRNKLKKILFPNEQFRSSLYKKIGSEFFDILENIRNYIEHK